MKTINLLPKPQQQELKYEAIFQKFLYVIWASLISFVLVFGTQLGTKIYLQRKDAEIKEQINVISQQSNKAENAQLKETIKQVNDVITDFTTIAGTSPRWSQFLQAFAVLPPQGVSIISLVVDNATDIATINGYSPTRDLVIQMYNNLTDDPKNFSNVDYPLENVAKPEKIYFHFSFLVNPALLR